MFACLLCNLSPTSKTWVSRTFACTLSRYPALGFWFTLFRCVVCAGTIRCSNLCTEIIEYTSPEEIAVCNLASVALPMFVTKEKQFDHKRLYDVAYVMTKNLNRVIDINYVSENNTADGMQTVWLFVSSC
jgi:hypothetical protein